MREIHVVLKPTCAVPTEQLDRGRHHGAVQGWNAAEGQLHQGRLEAVRQQREQEDRQVGHVAQVAHDRGHDPALRSLGHALDGGEEQHSLNDLREGDEGDYLERLCTPHFLQL